MSENKITEKNTDNLVLELLRGHGESVKVDLESFLDLLKHSLSLNTMEKKRVLDAIPVLTQFQFDELTKVFTEEREKFKELASKHPDDIKKLVAKQQSEWLELGELYIRIEEEKKIEGEDQSKIDDIKKNLGI